jgi:hypothetical protein
LDAPDVVRMPGQAVVFAAALIVAFMQLLPAGPARAVVVIPIVLLVPGWAAYVAIFGGARPADVVVGLTFMVALGMGVLIVNGLVLNAVGVRLSETTLVVGPALLACVMLIVARWGGADTSLPIPVAALPRAVVPAIVVCLSLVIGAAAVTYAADRLPSPVSQPFTELSFAPAYASAGQASRVVPGQVVTLPLELRLRGLAHVSYRVRTYLDGAQVGATNASVLAPLWSGAVSVAVPPGRCLHKVRVVFTPVGQARARTESVDTYLSVTTGAACRP